jgi:hypothetical protein
VFAHDFFEVEEMLVFESGDRSLFFTSLALVKGEDIEAEESDEDRIGAPRRFGAVCGKRRFGAICVTLVGGFAGGGVGIGFSGTSFSPSRTFLRIA